MHLTKQDLQIYKATSKDQVRPVLNAVLVKAEQKGKQWFLRLVATDSYKLVERLVPIDEKPQFKELLIDRRYFEEASRLVTTKDMVEFRPRKIVVRKDTHLFGGSGPEGSIIPFTQTEGTFPTYEQLIPKHSVKHVVIDPKLLKQVLELADGSITLSFKDPLAPVLLTSAGEGRENRTVIMPLRR